MRDERLAKENKSGGNSNTNQDYDAKEVSSGDNDAIITLEKQLKHERELSDEEAVEKLKLIEEIREAGINVTPILKKLKQCRYNRRSERIENKCLLKGSGDTSKVRDRIQRETSQRKIKKETLHLPNQNK